METLNNKQLNELIAATKEMQEMFTPREMENIVFDVFSAAEINTDGLPQQAKENRASVHNYLRTLFFAMADPGLQQTLRNFQNELQERI